mgnify:FL=1
MRMTDTVDYYGSSSNESGHPAATGVDKPSGNESR